MPSATAERGAETALGALLLALCGPAFGHQRGGEVHSGKIGAAQIRFPQDGDAQIRARESCTVHIRPAQIDVAQLRSLEICI